MSKKCLIVRLGAFGDMLIITPVIRELKKQGYEVIIETSERGQQMLANNPDVDEIIPYKTDSLQNSELEKHWKKLRKKIKPDKFINFSESLEMAISLHPSTPQYNYPKQERMKYAAMNFYEHSFDWADIDLVDYFEDFLPTINFTEQEEAKAKSLMKDDKYNIVVGLSGSGTNKCYPHMWEVISEILKSYANVNFITVGDENCKSLEFIIQEHSFFNPKDKERVVYKSGELTMRESIALTKHCDLVIAPDTGLLHGSGCFDTPKIGLFGHTTKENVTKHFKNDYSIETDPKLCECSPCSRLIYRAKEQCPTDTTSRATWCMHYGLPVDKVVKKVKEVIDYGKK